MIRLIACDVDGTLLQGEDTAVSAVIFQEITRLRGKGILFCPASGRQYSSLRRLFAPVADELMYLCENGAVIYGAGQPGPVLGKTVMDRAKAVALARDIIAADECEVMISGADTSYLCPKQDDITVLIRDFVGNNVAVISDPEEVPEDIIKVSAYCRRGSAQEEHGPLSRWSGQFRMAVAGVPWLDFTLADKGTGLRQMCAAVGISPEECMAFGDNFNDIPMLETAGTPYIMESADEALRRRFSRRCQRVEEVLAAL